MTNERPYVALMGDLVRSEHNDDTSNMHARFNAAVNRQNEACMDELASPLTITLGDEFQGLATSFIAAAHMAREIRMELLNAEINCRFALGLVTLKTPLNSSQAWNMMGSGLASVRERLNEKRTSSFYRFAIPEDAVLETLLEASGATLTAIERNWSDTQRRDIAALLHGDSVAEIARRRKVTVHNIYKVRASGDFDLYVIQWHAIHKALSSLDKRHSMEGMDKWSMRSFTPV